MMSGHSTRCSFLWREPEKSLSNPEWIGFHSVATVYVWFSFHWLFWLLRKKGFKGGRWDFRFCGFDQCLARFFVFRTWKLRFFSFGVFRGLWVFSNLILVFGFRFFSTMMAVFRFFFLSSTFYGFSGFANEVTSRSRAKTFNNSKDHSYSVPPFLLEEWMTRSQPYYAAHVNVSRDALFSSHSSHALNKKKHFLWCWYCDRKQIEVWFIVVCTLIDNNSFPKHFFVLFLHVERRVCESFWKESLTGTSSSFA